MFHCPLFWQPIILLLCPKSPSLLCLRLAIVRCFIRVRPSIKLINKTAGEWPLPVDINVCSGRCDMHRNLSVCGVNHTESLLLVVAATLTVNIHQSWKPGCEFALPLEASIYLPLHSLRLKVNGEQTFTSVNFAYVWNTHVVRKKNVKVDVKQQSCTGFLQNKSRRKIKGIRIMGHWNKSMTVFTTAKSTDRKQGW